MSNKKEIIKKCSYCKNEINIREECSDIFIERPKNTNNFYHKNCYIKKELSKKLNKKTEEEIKQYIEENNDMIQNYLMEMICKCDLNEFIKEMYQFNSVPTSVYTTLEEVYQGRYKGMNKPIQVSDLLDMWVQKKNYLLKVAEDNRRKGKDLNGFIQFRYDLAILVNKYDKYLEFKRKQRLAIEEEQKRKEEIKEQINYDSLHNRTYKNKEKEKKFDIYSILDEL